MFYKIKPCKEEKVECSAGAGFFLQLYCVIIAISLTVLTICFNYPQWRQNIDGWKFRERGIFFEEYDDYDIEEANEYIIPQSVQSKEIFQRYSDSPYRVKARIVPVHLDNTIHEGIREMKHISKKKFGRRKSKATDELYLMLDDTHSGMSNSPREYVNHKSLIDDDSIKYEDDPVEDTPQEKHFTDSKDSNDTEPSDALIIEKALGEDLPSPVPITQDQKKRSFKKGNEHVTYVVLTDSDNESDTHKESDVIQFTPPEIIRDANYSKQLESSFEEVLGREDECHDATESSSIFKLSDQVQIIGVSSGGKQYVHPVGDSIPSLTSTKSSSDGCHSIRNISDNEEQSDIFGDLDDENHTIENTDDTTSLLQDARAYLSDQEGSMYKYPVQQARQKNKSLEKESSDLQMVSDRPAHNHLNALIASLSFLNSNAHYKPMNRINDAVNDSKWHDVLESLNEEEMRSAPLRSRKAHDIDDETSHAIMVEKLRTYNVVNEATPLSSSRLDETAVVTDDEVSMEVASETLYDDEVEV